MKNIFKNLMKYAIFGIGVSILCIAFSANASTTTSFWTQTAPNVLMTNASGGLATATIHVSQCYIGTSTSTPCGGSGSGIAIGENIAGGTPTQILYTDNSGNLFSDADHTIDSSTGDMILKQDDGSNFDTYFGLNKNIDGFGIPGGILEQDDNTNNLQAVVTTTPAFSSEPSVLIAAEPISTGNVDESEIDVADLGNDTYGGQWNVLNNNQQVQTILQMNGTDAQLNYSTDGGNTTSGFSAFSGISEVNASDVGTGNSILFAEDAADKQYIFDQPNIQIDSVPYIFPSSQGTVGTTLTNDGTGTLSWSATAPQPPVSGVTIDVRVATAAVLSHSPIYDNGSSGVGATLTAASNGALTVNGIVVALNDLILVKDQASQLQNGVYDVTTLGDSSDEYVLTRDTQADMSAQFDDMVVTATEGSNRAINYAQQTQSVTIGTSNIVFSVQASPYVRQQASGTQVAGQIPVYTGTGSTITKGTPGLTFLASTGTFFAGASGSGNASIGINDQSQGQTELNSDTLNFNTSLGTLIGRATDSGGIAWSIGDVTGSGNGTTLTVSDSAKAIVLTNALALKPQYATPTTGSTVTSNSSTQLILNPAGALLALTIVFPPSPIDGQHFWITTTKAITTLTFSGGTVVGNPAGLALGGNQYVYSSSASEWILN